MDVHGLDDVVDLTDPRSGSSSQLPFTDSTRKTSVLISGKNIVLEQESIGNKELQVVQRCITKYLV